MPLEECRTLVAAVFARRLGPDAVPPRVEDGRGRRHAAGSREVIKLPRWARTRPVVLHECAHGLATDGHGPDFVRAYVELLVEFADFDRAMLEASLSAAGLQVTPAGQPLRQPALRQPRVAIGRNLGARLMAIGIRSMAQLRAIGAVQAWIRLKRCFGNAIGEASLLSLAAMEQGRPVEELDGRTRARIRFAALGQLLVARAHGVWMDRPRRPRTPR
ncbi:TfoX/Sxy family DNA transformation protein [Geminicoccus flavidas]|uniref:TfoX/Sxy family DNA transformation protein n=1 Tax=Geminicoccus flavidas TaxID=2506407 RepID=UPI0013592E0C|nr:TfoX/Sxy family DNA transformation protein [Geminicoccus flavidas]